tara:strand:+ start:148 stop:645 length:498 start_codon:yes stop_codon:yes gene_type:complete
MKMQKIYSTIKPYVATSLMLLTMTSFNVNAIEKNMEQANTVTNYQQADGNGKHDKKMKKRFHRLAKKLALTSEQRSKVKAIFANTKTTHQESKGSLAGFKEQVRSLMKTSEFDENNFTAIYMEYQPIFQQNAMARAKVQHQIMQVLTPEQQEKFLTMKAHRKDLG